MSSFVEPWVGLVWVTNSDPTVGPGVAAPLWQPLIRTDDQTLYYKSGQLSTDWTALNGGGGGGGGVIVEDEGTPVLSPATTLNFVGAGVTATDAGSGVARITIPGGIAGLTFEDEGTPIGGNPHAVVNFVGAGVTATNVGGVATVTIPGTLASLGIQSYRYVATGSEDPLGFPIPLQTGRADANYNAVAVAGDTTEDYTIQNPPSGYTNTQFTCVTGTAPAAGDILLITITPLT